MSQDSAADAGPPTLRDQEDPGTERLAQAHGPDELSCALLALLLPKGSRAALVVWQLETKATPYATRIRGEAIALGAAARLPWFELLLARMAGQPLRQRRALLAATRRLMRAPRAVPTRPAPQPHLLESARGSVRPIDTLHWLVMRRRLGEKAPQAAATAADRGFSRLSESDVYAIGRVTAFLSRLVPVESADGQAGAAWYASVMRRWQGHVDLPGQLPLPDTDAFVRALRSVATLPWMQRPVLVREWVSAALQTSPSGALADAGADALRMCATLLDSPLPPELAKHYIEPLR